MHAWFVLQEHILH